MTKTREQKLRDYFQVVKNPLADQRTTAEIQKLLEWWDTSSMSDEEKQLLNQIFA